MKSTPLFLGAIPLTIFAGALLGNAVATEPIARATDPIAELPRHEVETRTIEETRAMKAPRNQYPLKTPQGVIQVSELAYHGRLRQRLREQPFYGAHSEADAFGTVEMPAAGTQEPVAGEPRNLSANYVPLEPGVFENGAEAAPNPVRQTASSRPLARFAQRDAELEGKARVIDVESELAAGQ